MLTMALGNPGTGKTRLAKAAAARARRQGVPVLVFDPYRSDWPGAELVTDDPGHLERVALAKDGERRPLTRGCLVVVDEGGFELDQRPLRRLVGLLAGQRRHHGHSVVVIAHRYTEAHPKARTAADLVYLLRQGVDSGELACREWGLPRSLAAEVAELPDGQAVIIGPREGSPRRVRLW